MKNIFYISVLILLFVSEQSYSAFEKIDDKTSVELIKNNKPFYAGNKIVISFTSDSETLPKLFINSSYGSTLLNAKKQDQFINFTLPEIVSKKTGNINWVLIYNQEQLLSGTFKIEPNPDSKTQLESYFGPRQIQAGNVDYSMLVTVPTDGFDNPLPAETPVIIHQQFQENITASEEKTQNLMVWKNIYARRKAGSIVVSSTCDETNSKELTTVISPSNAVDFRIAFERNHDYADGNQQTEFYTSEIKDEFGNTISDGTLVEFSIMNTKNFVLKTFGETVNGVAKAKMLHPDSPDTWKVQAFISGLCVSNKLEVSYKPVIDDFVVEFSNNNRKIKVGPLQSFMDQRIPDGATVKLEISNNGIWVETKTESSSNGFVTFKLLPEFYKEKKYSFRVKALGITKDLGEKTLDEGDE